MWRQWFFENLESSRSCKKSASKKFFKCILKCLRNISLNPEYFSQYPGDPSFSFPCNLDFFDQLEFFFDFFGNFIEVKKIWKLKFWKILCTFKYPREGILKWFSSILAETQSLIFKSQSREQGFENGKKIRLDIYFEILGWNFAKPTWIMLPKGTKI